MNALDSDRPSIAVEAVVGSVVRFPEPETLFSRVDIALPRTPVPDPKAIAAIVSVYARRGVTLSVYSALPPAEAGSAIEPDTDPRQYGLALPRPARAVMAMIAPNQIAFMNASLRSIFRATRRQQNAMALLMRQDLLFCGDIIQLSRAELACKLERYSDLLPLIERELERLGLRLDAAAPWWQRPRDYYCANY